MRLTQFVEGFLKDHAPHWLYLIKNDMHQSENFEWYDESRHGKVPRDNNYFDCDTRTCLVGECYNFNPYYDPDHVRGRNVKDSEIITCMTCANFGRYFPHYLREAIRGDWHADRKLRARLASFAIHFLKCHSKIPKIQNNRPDMKEYQRGVKTRVT